MPRIPVTFSAADPAVIVPLTGADDAALTAQMAGLSDQPVDLVEWRVDLHTDAVRALPDAEVAVRALRAVSDRIGAVAPGTPILVTLRTAEEGGSATIADDHYVDLISALCASEAADLVDVEFGRPSAPAALQAAHDHGVPVVLSSHDFEGTPTASEMEERLARMESAGADVAKLAVMPRSGEDVAALLTATARRYAVASVPLTTMSMGQLGAVTRVGGTAFGSAATFATLGDASAPGQLPVSDVRRVLDLLRIDPDSGA